MSRQWIGMAWFVVSVIGLGTSGSRADPPGRYEDIPSDSIAVVSVELGTLRTHPGSAMIPWEIVEVACQEQLGFSLDSVDSIDLTIGMPSPLPEVGVSMRFNSDVDIEVLLDTIVGPVETSPKDDSLRFRDAVDLPQVRVAQREGRRVLVGTQGTLRRMLSQRLQTGGPTVQLVQSSDAPVRMALNFAKVRDLVAVAFEQASGPIPQSIQDDISAMINLIENVLVEIRPSSEKSLQVSMGTSSGPNADALLDCMNRLRTEGAELTKESLQSELDRDESVSDAMRGAIVRYSDRMQALFESQDLWSVEDDRVHLNMENSISTHYATIGVLTGLLLPAVQAAREAARRMSSSNNLRGIGLGLLNYESAYRKFPARVGKSQDGKPLLSWRVMILPYLEEQALYQEFHLDEPWDSEHNIRLLERMPAIYANPRVATLPGHTVYLIPYGEDKGWREDAFRMFDITDGTSNTIAVVEANGEVAVPWTQPEDLDIDEYSDGSWMPPGAGANVIMFDGSIQFLSRFIDAKTLEALFTIDGGEAVVLP